MSAMGPSAIIETLAELDISTYLAMKKALTKKTEEELSLGKVLSDVREDFEDYGDEVVESIIKEFREIERPGAKPVTAADLSARLSALILEGEDDLNKDAEFLARVGESQAAIVRQMGEVADSLGREADAVLAQSRSRFV